MRIDREFAKRLPETATGARFPDLLSPEQWTELIGALPLTGREADVLRAAFYDERYAAVAMRLGIRESTVHTYCDRMFLKLGTDSLTQALSFAVAAHLELTASRASAHPPKQQVSLADTGSASVRQETGPVGSIEDESTRTRAGLHSYGETKQLSSAR